MQSPDGVPMVRCSQDRANWYLSRNLAEVVSEEPYVIRLTFIPGGLGKADDPFYLQERANICVVCGTDQKLSRHHCIPSCFRRYFPIEIKECAAHDILPLCVKCHHKYERIADQKKKELCVKYDREPRTKRMKAYGAANTLLKVGNIIPDDVTEKLTQRVRDYLGKEEITFEDLCAVLEEGPFRAVVDWEMTAKTIDDIPAFIEMWRKHFVDTMKPQFMPEHWSIHGRIIGKCP